MKKGYYVTTWDYEGKQWTPQTGVRVGPYTKWGLRKALRKLRKLGYQADRHDSGVRVTRYDGTNRGTIND